MDVDMDAPHTESVTDLLTSSKANRRDQGADESDRDPKVSSFRDSQSFGEGQDDVRIRSSNDLGQNVAKKRKAEGLILTADKSSCKRQATIAGDGSPKAVNVEVKNFDSLSQDRQNQSSPACETSEENSEGKDSKGEDNTLEDSVPSLTMERAKQLLQEGYNLTVSQDLLNRLKYSIGLAKDWHHRLTLIECDKYNADSLTRSKMDRAKLEPLVEEAKRMVPQPDSLSALKDALTKSQEWSNRALRLFRDGMFLVLPFSSSAFSFFITVVRINMITVSHLCIAHNREATFRT